MDDLDVISKLMPYPIRSLVQKDELAFVIPVSVEREELKFYILNDLHKMIDNMKAMVFCKSPRIGGLLTEKTHI
ncbi:Eukaryotic initiation factor 4A-III [Metarhizium anisopliae]